MPSMSKLMCRGKAFTVNHVTKHTYICCLHWLGEAGPTEEFDVPFKATFTPKELFKATKPKGKLPREWQSPAPTKQRRLCSNTVPNSSKLENIINEDDLEEPKTRESSTQTNVSKHELSYKLEP